MTVTILPSVARGRVQAPTSKSIAHRALFLAAFSGGVCHISGVPMCEDIRATLSCLEALGVCYECAEDTVTVYGNAPKRTNAPLYVGESASTLRFFIPLALYLGAEMTFVGAPSLFCRPLSEYERLFGALSCKFILSEDSLYIDAREAKALPDALEVDASVSSQFVTGLVLLYTLSGGGVLSLCGRVASRPYIDLTLDALSRFGVHAQFHENKITIPRGQSLTATDCAVEGDASGGAFLEALSALGGEVTVDGLMSESLQGDFLYRELFPLLREGTPEIDLCDCPDLAPLLMALAAHFHGAVLLSTDRLKGKESDRGACMAEELAKLGARIDIEKDRITVHPSALHAPECALSSHGDHRIAMALSVLLSAYGGTITGCEAVKKSFPEFYQSLKSLGIRFTQG